jgi:zinc metalloprotease ZmpB
MKVVFNPNLKADLSLDDAEHIRYIDQSKRPWTSNKESPTLASIDYLNQIADVLHVSKEQLKNMHQQVSFLEPTEQGIEYRLSEEKRLFDSATISFTQTYLNVPVWQAGFTVTVKSNPYRIVSAVNTSQEGLDAKLPTEEKIERHKKLFKTAELNNQIRKLGLGEEKEESTETADFVRNLIDRRKFRKESRAASRNRRKDRGDNARLIRGRLYVYKYDEKNRLPPHRNKEFTSEKSAEEKSINSVEREYEPVLPLPPVDKKIKDGQYYLVAEVTFSFTTEEYGHINWLALVEVETESVLYLRALAYSLNGMVFVYDPISSTGDAANTSSQSNEVLNPFRTSVELPNLNAPMSGMQLLQGRYANVTNVEDPNIAAPINAPVIDFNYDVRTDDFAAVNAYYHVNRFFALVESLGFPVSTYFNNTIFPIQVDHRGIGNVINAHFVGDGIGGIGHLCYALNDTSNTTNPVGRACDSWVHLHELGHAALYEHVNSGRLGFSHSAGDSLAAIVNDPESQAPDRFLYAPWRPLTNRRFDRQVAEGWAWEGHIDKDDGEYGSEQILATTLFRVYRSIGGDDTRLARQQFASRMMTYFILRTISTLTPTTNPNNPLGFANALMAVDLLNWTTEGVYGGAYNKVIRWSFERQGLYQAPGAPTPVTTPGQPPPVDVYIEDGRGGEYPYQPVHWNNTSIWNRRNPDGMTTHEEPALSNTNYAYVKIKNRGTQTANNVRVRGYHCRPSAGVVWPNDFQSLATAELSAGTLAENNLEEKIVGPFEWIPITNAYGHDCMLMVVSAGDDDPSNIDNFITGEFIPDWRLVPNDNNIAQRNVNPVPGGGGIEGLMQGLNGYSFWVGNPNLKTSSMELRVELPDLLASNGWRLSFKGIPNNNNNKFELQPGKHQEIFIDLLPGKDFDKQQVEKSNNKDIMISAYANDILVGGMTYRLDPEIKEPYNNKPHEKPVQKLRTVVTTADKSKSLDKIQELLSQMNISVKKVTVEIEL